MVRRWAGPSTVFPFPDFVRPVYVQTVSIELKQVQSKMEEPQFGKKLAERMWKIEGLFAEAKQNHCLSAQSIAAGQKCRSKPTCARWCRTSNACSSCFTGGSWFGGSTSDLDQLHQPAPPFTNRTFSTGPVD